MAMALLHDLAEVRLTDLPASAVKLIPESAKSQCRGIGCWRPLGSSPCGGTMECLVAGV